MTANFVVNCSRAFLSVCICLYIIYVSLLVCICLYYVCVIVSSRVFCQCVFVLFFSVFVSFRVFCQCVFVCILFLCPCQFLSILSACISLYIISVFLSVNCFSDLPVCSCQHVISVNWSVDCLRVLCVFVRNLFMCICRYPYITTAIFLGPTAIVNSYIDLQSLQPCWAFCLL